MQLIVVPCVNNLSLTKKCIQSCLDQDIEGGVNILAIDNGSTDGTGQWLRSLIGYGQRNIMVLSHLHPISLNRVWNDSLLLAFKSLKLDYALVINNDIVMRKDMFRLLVADGGQFVTGVSVDDPAQAAEINPLSKSPHPSFSCFLIRKEVWEKVGKFDEDYWAYCSDGSYHLQMDRAGIDAYALAIPFYHEISGTMKHMTNEQRDRLQQRADQDRATFIRKWGFAIGSPEYYGHFRVQRENLYESSGRLG